MSRKIINQMLGLAAMNADFCRLLLMSPVDAARQQGFDLTYNEREALHTVVANNLQEFSQQLLTKLDFTS